MELWGLLTVKGFIAVYIQQVEDFQKKLHIPTRQKAIAPIQMYETENVGENFHCLNSAQIDRL